MADIFQIRKGDSLQELLLAAGDDANGQAVLSWLHEPAAENKPTTLSDLSTGTLEFSAWRTDRTAAEAAAVGTATYDVAVPGANVHVAFTTGETAALQAGQYNGILVHTDAPAQRTFPVCTTFLFEVCE